MDVEGGPGVLVLEVVEDLEGEVVVVGGVGRRGRRGMGGYEGGEGGRGRGDGGHGGLEVSIILFGGLARDGFSELVAWSWRPDWLLESCGFVAGLASLKLLTPITGHLEG